MGGKRSRIAAAFTHGHCMIVLNATYESISIDDASDIETPCTYNESPIIAWLPAAEVRAAKASGKEQRTLTIVTTHLAF